jgi:hypothetical protein
MGRSCGTAEAVPSQNHLYGTAEAVPSQNHSCGTAEAVPYKIHEITRIALAGITDLQIVSFRWMDISRQQIGLEVILVMDEKVEARVPQR